MKCPMLLPIIYQLGGLPNGDEDECKKEDCAWWYEDNSQCAILTLAQGAVYLHRVALSIGEKLPHDATWRR